MTKEGFVISDKGRFVFSWWSTDREHDWEYSQVPDMIWDTEEDAQWYIGNFLPSDIPWKIIPVKVTYEVKN